MFGLGFTEIITILVIVLLVLGPDKLPEFTRTLGKTIWKIRHAADELRDELRLDNLDRYEDEDPHEKEDQAEKEDAQEQKDSEEKSDE